MSKECAPWPQCYYDELDARKRKDLLDKAIENGEGAPEENAVRQQALRDAVQHNANGCQNVLQEFQKKHPFLKNRAAPQGSGQLCRKTPLLSRILRNARTIYYNKAFLYGN